MQTTNEINPGVYKVGLRLGYEEFPLSIVECLKVLSISYVPDFFGDYIPEQTIFVGDKWQIEIPKYKEIFGNEAQMEIELGETENFLAYDKESRTLKLNVEPYILE